MNEETNELEDYPEPEPTPFSKFLENYNPGSTFKPSGEIDDWLQKFKGQIGGDTTQGFLGVKLIPPTEDNKTESQPE